jgi:prophage antirepressor-like protein
MSKLTIFEFNSHQIRIINIDGNPWFVAKDVCSVLEHSDVSMACSRLKEFEKGKSSICTPGGKQDLLCISESGLYRMVLTSRKPQAESFQDWVVQEVLPSIRKTGKFEVAPAPEPVRQLPPVRDAVEYIAASEKLEKVNNLTLRELLRDELIDELSVKRGIKQLAAAPKEYTTVKVRARELGYSTTEIGNGTALGKFVSKLVLTAFSERVGKYAVKHYEVNDQLDTAIKSYFGMKRAMA